MKKILNYLMIALFMVSINACRSSKNINIPCDENSDREYYRAMGIGESIDLSTSMKKSLIAAQTNVSLLIETRVQNLVETYTGSVSNGQQEALGKSFQEASRNSVDQMLRNTTISCKKTVQEKNGMYKTYTAVEISKSELKDELDKAILSETQKRNIEYDRDKFFQNFDNQTN